MKSKKHSRMLEERHQHCAEPSEGRFWGKWSHDEFISGFASQALLHGVGFVGIMWSWDQQ